MTDRPVSTLGGVLAVALGLGAVADTGFAAALGVTEAAVLLVGGLAFVQAVRVADARRRSDVEGAETGDPELVEPTPTPGEEFDATLAAIHSGPRRTTKRNRQAIHERLRAAAVAAVARRENCSREAAEELLDSGEWTDDPHAAAFLGGPEVASPPLTDWLRGLVSGESSFQREVRHTADAVARAADIAESSDAGASPDEGEGDR